ncbi:MAG: hypothetical protein ACRDK4_08335 [Solirubrobacteraceae bacterium]
MSEFKKEVIRHWIREHPESDAYRAICQLPREQRHPLMRDLPYITRGR